MAIELYVFLKSKRIPAHQSWQAAITASRFPAVLEPFDVRSETGFRRATYGDSQTGFEFYLEPSHEVIGSYPHVADKAGARNTCATFRWSGDLNEMSAALAAAAALTKLSEGVYYYPDDDILYTADQVVPATRRDLNLE
jgi:hypothetical protein